MSMASGGGQLRRAWQVQRTTGREHRAVDTGGERDTVRRTSGGEPVAAHRKGRGRAQRRTAEDAGRQTTEGERDRPTNERA
ncbi:hypothetical protein ACGFXB_16640 [Streptomyces canus]|uniref:hypothetical protein n=1 Tax=Streptomyces canus TaxID=58343 RepID=UPI0037144FF5